MADLQQVTFKLSQIFNNFLTNSIKWKKNKRNYLCTQLEVYHDNTNLRAGDDQDDENQEEEPKQVVELILPDCLQMRHVDSGLRPNTRLTFTFTPFL